MIVTAEIRTSKLGSLILQDHALTGVPTTPHPPRNSKTVAFNLPRNLNLGASPTASQAHPIKSMKGRRGGTDREIRHVYFDKQTAWIDLSRALKFISIMCYHLSNFSSSVGPVGLARWKFSVPVAKLAYSPSPYVFSGRMTLASLPRC